MLPTCCSLFCAKIMSNKRSSGPRLFLPLCIASCGGIWKVMSAWRCCCVSSHAWSGLLSISKEWICIFISCFLLWALIREIETQKLGDVWQCTTLWRIEMYLLHWSSQWDSSQDFHESKKLNEPSTTRWGWELTELVAFSIWPVWESRLETHVLNFKIQTTSQV